MKKGIIIAILAVLIIAVVGVYVFDIVRNDTEPTKHLFSALAAVVLCIGGMIRACVPLGKRKSLSFYESQYTDVLKNAFSNSPFNRKKLLCAIRLYNEDNFDKALKYLGQLQPECKEKDDFEAVGIFLALIFTDTECYEDAATIYGQLIDMGITSSRIYSNLGHVHSQMGNKGEAIANLRLAIQNDPKNAYTYNNLASLYFDTYDFERAKRYAKEALDINHKLRQSASLLAIIYALEENAEEQKKYTHIALSCGEKLETLQNAIAHFKVNAVPEEDGTEENTEE